MIISLRSYNLNSLTRSLARSLARKNVHSIDRPTGKLRERERKHSLSLPKFDHVFANRNAPICALAPPDAATCIAAAHLINIGRRRRRRFPLILSFF